MKAVRKKSQNPAISRQLLSDLQWAASESSEYLLSARDCKALVTASTREKLKRKRP